MRQTRTPGRTIVKRDRLDVTCATDTTCSARDVAAAGHRRRCARRRSLAGSSAALALILVLVCACGTPSQPSGTPGTKQLRIWLTGYSWQDNTPPGSSKIGEPVLHQQAGGQGTYQDPITVAVPGRAGHMDWAPGTRFYLPTVQRYVIVEDYGATHTPSGTDAHLDMWIGGQDGTREDTDACMRQLTSKHAPAQLNPPPDLPVTPGPIYANHRCNIPSGS